MEAYLRTIEEQIFDRRCDAASMGNEEDVIFFDELLTRIEDFDNLQPKIEELEYEIQSMVDKLEKIKSLCDD